MEKMKMHWIFWVLLAIAVLAAIIWVLPKSSDINGNGNINVTGGECKIDLDCVQIECCHATSCVAREKAPNCNDIMCSQECVPNTLDCGQGSCACNQGICGASFK